LRSALRGVQVESSMRTLPVVMLDVGCQEALEVAGPRTMTRPRHSVRTVRTVRIHLSA
jgi:hypothetical protein